MKAQISKDSDQPDKAYSGIYQQQGRMLTDADWNELVQILKRRQSRATEIGVGSGVVGSSPSERAMGVSGDGALSVQERRTGPGEVALDVSLAWGSVVVDGIVAEIRPIPGAEAAFKYAEQRDFPKPPSALSEDDCTLYVDVWERLVVSLQDPNLRDPGLHGADTCVRTQVLAQVKYSPDADLVSDSGRNPPVGTASFHLERAENATDVGDPCLGETSAKTDLGNSLFRLEVHHVMGKPDEPSKITLKWSSENGAEAHLVDERPADFEDEPRVYEFFSDTSERHLGVHLGNNEIHRGILVTHGYPDATPSDPSGDIFPYVRRWDGSCTLKYDGTSLALVEGQHLGRDLVATSDNGTSDGKLSLRLDNLVLTLTCEGRTFVAGDHWLALLRGHLLPDSQPQVLSPTPVGIVHHYLRLLTSEGGAITYPTVKDGLRGLSFPRLTDLNADRIGYDPSITAVRWQDINEDGKDLPYTVQDAIDQITGNLDATDVEFVVPDCGEVLSVAHLMSDVADWPDLDHDGKTSVRDMLDAFLCHLDAGRIPYSETAGGTIREWLDTLRDDVDARVKIAGDTMTSDLAVMTKVGIGFDREGGVVKGGKLHIKGGDVAETDSHPSTAIEIDHAGDNTTILQANGPDGPFRIALQDGHGRVGQTWNAYDSDSIHRYDHDDEGANWLRFHNGTFAFHTAPGGFAEEEIPWNIGITQDANGYVGIRTEKPTTELDVNGTARAGKIETSGFKMATGAGAGLVLTCDANGNGRWVSSGGEAGVPPGVIVALAIRDRAPPGWVLCDGSSYDGSRAEFGALFRVIDKTFGAGNGSTMGFNVPDMRALFVRGWNGTSSGRDAGRKFGSVQGDGLVSHSHQLNGYTNYSLGSGSMEVVTSVVAVNTKDRALRGVASHRHSLGGPTSDIGGNETRPANIALNFCIKL